MGDLPEPVMGVATFYPLAKGSLSFFINDVDSSCYDHPAV
jgi:hypothetical protein